MAFMFVLVNFIADICYMLIDPRIATTERRGGIAMKTILDMLRKSTITAKIGLFIVLVWILCAVFAPFISPHAPEAVDIMQRMKPPAWQDGGSMEHVLGTDEMGRDVLSRLIYGARISLVIGVCSVVVGMTIGVVLGLLAGYIGGWVDAVIMRPGGYDAGVSLYVLSPFAWLRYWVPVWKTSL